MITKWKPIKTAPKNTELLVCRCVGDQWVVGQSSLRFDSGSIDEPSYWYWSTDNCCDSLVEDEGPSYWQELPQLPQHCESAETPLADVV